MKKRIIVGVSAVLCLCIILGLLQALLMPKYIQNPEGLLTGEYYAEAGGHDVIFVGDCEVYENFVPAVMWEEYGISSYVRGSAQQLVWQSYYLLEETFKYETPKVVVFNVLALKYGKPQNEAFNRMTLDSMKWSSEKWEAVKASMTEDEQMLDYIFPLLRFHSRITDINSDDFKYIFTPKKVSHSGYLMQKTVVPQTVADDEGRKLLDYTLPESAMDYLDKMRELCEQNGSELILIKAPTNSWAYWWYDEWNTQICDYAEKYGLAYYNFIEHTEEMGIDWSQDTYDAGVHLNVYGAEKLTRYFGEILKEKHGLDGVEHSEGECAVWSERVKKYKEELGG